MTAIRACTIVARNYLPYARVLARSLRAVHPDAAMTVLVLDGAAGSDAEPFEVLGLPDVVTDPEERQRLAFIYDVTELATAVKPLLLAGLAREGGAALYFDPDVEIFAPLDEIWHATRESSITLVPHVLSPIPDDALGITDLFVLRAGMFNLGYLGVGPGSEPFLAWWWDRLRRYCINEPDLGMFVDQRWADFIPSLFRHAILRDPGLDVAYWNLHERRLEPGPDGIAVNGRPLRFFHFSGFDPMTPHLLSRHQGRQPRILLSERPVVRGLCDAYAAKLAACGWTPIAIPYAYARLPSGLPIDLPTRRLYRQELLDAERLDRPRPPLPFEGEALVEWLNAPSPIAPGLSRYLHALREMRPDIQRAFPSPYGESAAHYRRWASGAESIPEAFRPLALIEGRSQLRASGGLNIAGYLHAELGVGEVARSLTSAAREAGIGVRPVVNDATASRQTETFELGNDGPPFGVTLVCANADELPRAVDTLPRALAEDCHRIGFWFWETEELPAEFGSAADVVDEIWTASEYVAEAVRRTVDKPVYISPLYLRPAAPGSLTRLDLGLPRGYVFLFLFDFLSVPERKNPLGLIEAFSRAFRPGEGPTLVLKSINGHVARTELEAVKTAARCRPDVMVIDGYVSREHRDAFIHHCDCYVSLHRSEGFGLTLAEAMALGKPTIATGYSGNLSFMTAENSYLVPWRPSLVPAGCDPYPEGHRWADPDLDAAARLMRTVHENPALAKDRARKGQAEVRERLSARATAAFMRGRLRAIERVRAARAEAKDEPECRPAAGPREAVVPLASLDALAEATMETHQLVQAGIPFATPSPWGWPGRMLRSAVLRLLRPYVEFERDVQGRQLRAVSRFLLELRGAEEVPGDDALEDERGRRP